MGRYSSELYEKDFQGKITTLNTKGSRIINMSKFMESEFVQAGLDKIERLQQEIFEEVMDYPNLDYDEKLEHLGKLEELIETQSLMYARMSLSDDPAAIERRKNIQEFCEMMGFAGGNDVRSVFEEMKATVRGMKEDLDS